MTKKTYLWKYPISYKITFISRTYLKSLSFLQLDIPKNNNTLFNYRKPIVDSGSTY